MPLCRSRGEPGRARHRGEQVQWRVWCSARRLSFSQAFAAPEGAMNRAPTIAGCYEVQTHCLALGGLASRPLSCVNNPGD
jgi:hypothetical protein